MGRARRIAGEHPGKGSPGGAWQVVTGAGFVLAGLLWVMSMFNSYLIKIPGVSQGIALLQQAASEYLGAFAFGFALVGGVFAVALSRVPELSLSGMKWRNPLHQWTSDQERLSFQEQRRTWEQERKRLLREAEVLARLVPDPRFQGRW